VALHGDYGILEICIIRPLRQAQFSG